MMQQNSRTYRRPKARRWPLWGVIAALAVAGAAFGLWQVRDNVQGKSPAQVVAALEQAATGKQAAQPQQAASAYQTTPVRRGDLSLSATGTGKVVPTQSIDLNFTASGKIAQINVQVGDQVTAGQVLAAQDNIDALKQAVDQKQLDLISAQNALDQLTSNSAINLAQASSDLATAQQAYAQAQTGVHDPHDPRCAPSLTEKYYEQYLSYTILAKPWEDALGSSKTGYSRNYILQNLYPIKDKENQAYYNYQWCQNYTQLEIQASQAALQVAQANMNQAQAKYQTLQANKGIDPNALALAQATLVNAQKQFDVAKANLDGATIVAPVSGTVTAVNGVVGGTSGQTSSSTNSSSSSSSKNSSSGSLNSASGSSSSSNGNSSNSSSSSSSSSSASTPLITIVDMNHPQVQVNIDETDLPNFSVGCPAQVIFGALPNQTYTGTVAQVYPALVTVSNSSEAQGLVNLAQQAQKDGAPFLLGLSAQVNITCQQAANALMVPIQALHQNSSQSYYVYLLNAQGQPEKRDVQVGLKTTAFAEIKSGLKTGDEVITNFGAAGQVK